MSSHVADHLNHHLKKKGSSKLHKKVDEEVDPLSFLTSEELRAVVQHLNRKAKDAAEVVSKDESALVEPCIDCGDLKVSAIDKIAQDKEKAKHAQELADRAQKEVEKARARERVS